MELRELRVTRLPGIENPFAINGEPGLNLVIGPNGSGKSSLSRAALGLLWPDPDTTGQIVAATWDIDGKPWLAERTGGPAVRWQHDGEDAGAPALVSAHRAGIYRLGVLDLLRSTTDRTGQELATEIRRQLAGGIDLAVLRRHFERTGREGQGKAQQLDETRRRIRTLTGKQRELAAEEARLADLEDQHRAAREAADRQLALDAGRALATAMTALQDATGSLDSFPAVMASLRGNEDERLDDLLAARGQADAELAEVARSVADAERDRDAANLADGVPDDAVLDALRQEFADARELVAERRAADDELAAAEAAIEQARAQLGPIEAPDAGEPVTAEQAAATVTRLRDRDHLRAVRNGLDRLLARDDLGKGTAAAEPATLEAARKALANWLAAAAPAVPWPLRVLPWLSATILVVVGVVLMPWNSGAWVGWVALGAGVALMPAWLLLRRRSHGARSRRLAQARAAFDATEVIAPEAWNRDLVERRLRGLLAEEAAAAQARLRDQLRLALQGDRDQAADTLGDDDPAAELDQALVLQRVAAWHAAVAGEASARKRAEQAGSRLASLQASLGERLATWWQGDVDDIVALGSAVTDLERRRDRHRDATARLAAAEVQQDAARERRDNAAATITALLGPLAFSEDEAAAALGELMPRLEDFRAASTAVDRATVERNRCHRVCDDLVTPLDAIAREAVALPAARLDAAIEDAAARAARADELLRELSDIEGRVREARADAELTAAHAGEESLVRDLAAIRDSVRGNALANLLLERATARFEAATEPPLLRRTQVLFVRFTEGRYGLTVTEDGDGARFLARESATGRGLGLDELSGGTRAQLLLAARLAALPEHERGVRPPLFLDESLTASDPVRFEAVGKAVLDLVREEERQVFYLTCDPADVAAWQSLLRDAGEAPAPTIDLAAARNLAAAAEPARLRPARASSVPPAGKDAAAFGKAISVPPLSHGQSPAGVHLFHLLRDDLPLLHGLLVRRVTTLGEFESLTEDLFADGALDPAARDRLGARARALTAFLDAFAAGRGRPIPGGALLHESGIESKLLEEIEELAATLDGDAARLATALSEGKIKGMRQSKKDEIADWLTAAGYLDRRPIATRDEVRHGTIRALRADFSAGAIDWTALDMLIDAWWAAAGGEPDTANS